MVHGIAALLAGLLVLATVLLVSIDFVRTRVRRAREHVIRGEMAKVLEAKDDGTRHLERQVDEKLEEMETLKGLSGITSGLGKEVRAKLVATTTGTGRGSRISDSQIARDFQAKAEEVMRLARKKPANG